jgi:hypothetical protein
MKPKKQKEDDGLRKTINTPTLIEQIALQEAKKQAKATFDAQWSLAAIRTTRR